MRFHRGRLLDHVHLHTSGYDAAFLLDPDGSDIEAVYHGPAKRSAAAVVIDAG